MKRVLMVSTAASMIEQFNMPNIKLLKKLGYEVDVASNFIEGNTCTSDIIDKLKKELEELGVRYFQIDFSRSAKNFRQHKISRKQIAELLENNEYCFIHTHTPVASALVRLEAKKRNIKVIYTAHGYSFEYKGDGQQEEISGSWMYYKIEKYLSKFTDTIININEEDYNFSKEKLKAKNIEYIPGVGVDVKEIDKIKIDWKKKRESLGVHDDELIFLSVGELGTRKNHIRVIEALSSLKYELKFKYFICGIGDQEEVLKDYIKQQELDGKVILLGYRTDIIELCKVCDLYIFPSLREGLPVSLMEAMACDVPIICSKVRGNVDLIKDSRFYFNPLSYLDIKKAILTAVDLSKEEYRMYLKQNYETVKKCDVHEICKKMENIYKRVGEK
ncbi:glycosyltransferase [Lachnobacterium bovis]|uniref:glycosyltransferase n=1 Tax=Lachnobacterium bovis TaxID=140626 RepID=UPI00048DCE1D|nr:glycosyltransferase [Lachnobacterium bovis]